MRACPKAEMVAVGRRHTETLSTHTRMADALLAAGEPVSKHVNSAGKMPPPLM